MLLPILRRPPTPILARWGPVYSIKPHSVPLTVPHHVQPSLPTPPPLPKLQSFQFSVSDKQLGGWCGGGGEITYQKTLVFCMFSDTAERALRHLHLWSINGQSIANQRQIYPRNLRTRPKKRKRDRPAGQRWNSHQNGLCFSRCSWIFWNPSTCKKPL